jgi:hypothetical protein
LRQTTQDKKNCRRLDAILRISTLKTYLARRKKKERYLPVEGKKKAKVVEVEEGASEFLFAFASLPLSLSSLPFQKKKTQPLHPRAPPLRASFLFKMAPAKGKQTRSSVSVGQQLARRSAGSNAGWSNERQSRSRPSAAAAAASSITLLFLSLALSAAAAAAALVPFKLQNSARFCSS